MTNDQFTEGRLLNRAEQVAELRLLYKVRAWVVARIAELEAITQ